MSKSLPEAGRFDLFNMRFDSIEILWFDFENDSVCKAEDNACFY